MALKKANKKCQKNYVKQERKYGLLFAVSKSKRNYFPGQHGATAQRKPSDYGVQFKAKQRFRAYYGIRVEKTLRRLYKEAIRMRGDNSENLVGLLERRLVSVVYRMNFAPTMNAARQMISHKHITVNGQTVNLAGYAVKPGDVIEVKTEFRENTNLLSSLSKGVNDVPSYMEVDIKSFKGTFIMIPKFADIPYPHLMEPHLLIEFYSR